jgi:hypothetical protein
MRILMLRVSRRAHLLAPFNPTDGLVTPTCKSFGEKRTPAVLKCTMRKLERRLRTVVPDGGPQITDFLERETGLEPATSSLGSWHSTN